MSNPTFKQDFENSLQRLAQINTAIDANIKGKQDFSAMIIQKLSAINEKVKQLGDSINALKEQLTNLQTQAATNNSQIGDKSKEVENLTSQITQLTGDRDKCLAELDQLKQQYQADVQDFQKRIDECEDKLRQLNDQNTTITAERDSIRNELEQKGDLGTAHADELKKLTDQHAQELQQKDEQLKLIQEDNASKMKQLQDEIAAKETELNQQVADVGNNAGQLQTQIEQLTKEKQEKEDQITGLQEQITGLQTENQDLISRIMAATQAIIESTNRLGELNNPDAFNEAELNAKFKEVEASIQQISNAIQGNSVANNQLAAGQPESVKGKLPPDTPIIIDGINFTLGSIITQLKAKKQKVKHTGEPNKYTLALDAVYKANTPEEVIEALKSNVTLKNGAIMGGKKTRKNKKQRKQKGGYTYKVNSKRKSITTASIRSGGSIRGRRITKRR